MTLMENGDGSPKQPKDRRTRSDWSASARAEQWAQCDDTVTQGRPLALSRPCPGNIAQGRPGGSCRVNGSAFVCSSHRGRYSAFLTAAPDSLPR
jgi:hypothetical protein